MTRRARETAVVAFAIVLLGALAAGVSARAQSPQAGAESPLAGLIRVDAVVLDEDGRPVRGLTRDDFDLFERGSRRAIYAFRELAPAEASGDPRVHPLPVGVRRDISSNEAGLAERLVLLAVDDRAPDPGSTGRVLAAARRFIDGLTSDSVVGVVFASGRPGLELRRDRELLRDVLADRAWDTGRQAAKDWAEGGRTPLGMLTDAARRLPPGTGRRRAVVWIADEASLPFVRDDQAERAFLEASHHVGIVVHALHLGNGESGDARSPWPDLVRRTGGRTFAGSAEVATAAAAVLSEMDYGYLLAFEPQPGEPVNRVQDVEVRLDRRYRYVVRHGSGRRQAGEDRATRPGAGDPLPGVVPRADVAIRMFAAPFPSSGREVPVAIAFEMSLPRAPLEAVDPLLRDRVEYVVRTIDVTSGRATERRREEDAVALRPRYGTRSDDTRLVYEFVTWTDLPPGRHQLELTARSRTLDVGGSAYFTLDVPAYDRGQPALGSLVLGYPIGTNVLSVQEQAADVNVPDLRRAFGGQGAGAISRPVPSPPRMRIDPTLGRHFEAWDDVKLFFEVGLDGVADEARADVELVDASGRVVATESARTRRRDDGRVTVDLPLATLVPGPYRVRVRVIAGDKAVSREVGIAINGVLPDPDEPRAEMPSSGRGAVPLSVPAVVPPVASLGAPPPNVEGAAAEPSASLRLRPGGLTLADQLRDLGDANRLASEGWDLYSKGDVEGAQVKLAAAVAAGSHSVWIHYARGLAEFALGHFEVAAESWEFVRQHEPGHQPVYFDLTDAYLSLDRSADALVVLQEAARRWTADPEVHNALGVVQYSRGQIDEAIDTFLRAVAAAPEDGLSHFNLGRAYHGRMLRWRASRTVQTASATSALADRDRQSAVRAYQRALALGGSFEWDAREALRALGGG